MSNLDWVMPCLIMPCLLVKSTRVPALVLLLVFPFYYLIKATVEPGFIRYIMFGTQDAMVCIAFLYLATKNKPYKMEWCLSALAASAVILHFIGWGLRANNLNNAFYVNGCIIILTLQITMLYARLTFNGRLFSNTDRSVVFRFFNIPDYYRGNKHYKKMQTIKNERTLWAEK